MLQNLILSFILLFSALNINAQSLSATQILNRIHFEYAQRFDGNGKYIDDNNLMNNFKVSQISAIELLRKNKMIGQSFTIKNTAMSDLVITVSVVHEQNFDFAGLLIERNKYEHPTSEALLRLFNFPILAGNMSLFMMNGSSVINVKSENLTALSGGHILIRYPIDHNDNQFSQSSISLIRTVHGFTFKAPNGAALNSMTLDVWYSLFSQNFGVKGVAFQ